MLIFTPFFHRDDTRLDHADAFAPEIWLDGYPPRHWPLLPFSDGPAGCPGRNLVLLLTSTMLAALLADRDVQLAEPQALSREQRLPA